MEMPNHVAEILKEMMSWRVVLDILLIGMAIFLTYRTLHRLGTWKILTGLLIAIVLFGAAKMLDLSGIIWIYSNLSHVIVIALIIIFQPELRKLLERAASMGRKKISRGSTDLSDTIGDAVFTLAQQRRGAILVFPGKEPITQWLAGGFSLDGESSFSLIMSIFDPNSPGHDGAMVIENGRVPSFGLRLPLSKTGALSKELGTRHHAAMGLSEVCAAMVVVVSEERRNVTTFCGGKMERVEGKNALSSKTMSHWQNAASYTFLAQKGGKKWLLVSQVCLSLALAFVFWFVVIFAQAEMRERVFSVPIEYIATPQHIALVGEKPTEVNRCREVIGINTSVLVGVENIGFAVPINIAKRALDELSNKGRIIRPWLGFRGKIIKKEQLQAIFNLPFADGFLVETVEPGSPAEQAGIRGGELPIKIAGEELLIGGDIITAANKQPLTDLQRFESFARSEKISDKVLLEMVRGTKKHKVEFTIVERPLLPWDFPPAEPRGLSPLWDRTPTWKSSQ